jgi:hypothetical protein
MDAPKIKVRPLTVLFVTAAVVLTATGVYYFVTPAHNRQQARLLDRSAGVALSIMK